MPVAEKLSYLTEIATKLWAQWPDNRTINIVCHGHSVPAGYFSHPIIRTFDSYPHLLHVGINAHYPHAVTNVIVTAIGGENSQSGAGRMNDVLSHKPRVITIDYSLNDHAIGLDIAQSSWRSMIERSLKEGVKVILLTPTADRSSLSETTMPDWDRLQLHAQQVRDLADEYEIGLVDSMKIFERYVNNGGCMADLLSWHNHPNRKGHELVANELISWFIAPPIIEAEK